MERTHSPGTKSPPSLCPTCSQASSAFATRWVTVISVRRGDPRGQCLGSELFWGLCYPSSPCKPAGLKEPRARGLLSLWKSRAAEIFCDFIFLDAKGHTLNITTLKIQQAGRWTPQRQLLLLFSFFPKLKGQSDELKMNGRGLAGREAHASPSPHTDTSKRQVTKLQTLSSGVIKSN